MPKNNNERTYITEHILELRHEATGNFLDCRGFIADYIKKNGLFPHWSIIENSVSFFDTEKGINDVGAVVSYNRVCFLSYDPSTENYFEQKALQFWKTLQNNKHYIIPTIERFGARTKCYVPSKLSFIEISKRINTEFFNEKLAITIGAKPTDLQIVLDLKDSDFQIRIILGPVRENEAGRYFSFKSDEFGQGGIYIDVDYFQAEKIPHDHVKSLLAKTMKLVWPKIERITNAIGI